ncbi:MAG: sensor histidine kinase N-terminal domain-containing protein [Betaproteobacteria bacterium]
MSERRATLRSQLLRWLLIPLSLLFVVDAIGSYLLAHRLAVRVQDGELVEIARELALHVKPQGDTLVFDLEKDAERTLLLDEVDQLHYAISDGGGVRIAGDADLAPTRAGAASGGFRDAMLDGEPVRVVELRTLAAGRAMVVEVAGTGIKRRELTDEIVVDVILPQLLLILIAGLLVWFGVARGLRPLKHLQQAVAARSHRDLSPVAAADIPGEVHPLLLSINDLMSRLDDVLGRQNRFIADAAHQLRTPVAGLKAHIEVALREEDPGEMRQSIAQLYIGVERMSRLVAQLLSLARNEPNAVKSLALEEIDLAKLAFDVTMEWVPQAFRRNIDLGFDGAREHVTVRGDATRLTELINNLLDNAIRYSRDRGRVTVSVVATPEPRISVSDDGPTIPVPDRERVFERFHRLLGTHADGSGLGLAIVREIATLHGARIVLDDDVDGVGNTFSVSFPPPAHAGQPA